MAVALISDIHANLEALLAVLKDIAHVTQQYGIEGIHCLGDIVNYGAEPAECVARIREYCAVVLKGNHDVAAATLNPVLMDTWGSEQQDGARWTRSQLQQVDLDYLAALPALHQQDGLVEVHGTPCTQLQGNDVHYVADDRKNLEYAMFTLYCSPHEKDKANLTRGFASLRAMGKRVCVVGHAQRAEMYRSYDSNPQQIIGTSFVSPLFDKFHPEYERLKDHDGVLETRIRLQDDCTYIIDVGSVGQPRDDDQRASYGIYTGKEFINRRVPYDVKEAARKIRATGKLYDWFASRLFEGK